MRFNADDNTIDLSTDLDLDTSELFCNKFNTSTLDTKISFYDGAFEYMKYANINVDATFYGLKV